MTELQTKIDKIRAGDTAAIIRGISSQSDLIVINSILAGAKLKLADKDFIDGVKKAQNSNVVLLGFPIKSIAEAAIYFLTDTEYSGDDALIRELIDNRFNI